MVCYRSKKGKGSRYSIAERRVPELIPVLGSQPAGDVSHKPGSRMPLLSARPAVTLTTLKYTCIYASIPCIICMISIGRTSGLVVSCGHHRGDAAAG